MGGHGRRKFRENIEEYVVAIEVNGFIYFQTIRRTGKHGNIKRFAGLRKTKVYYETTCYYKSGYNYEY